MRESRRRRDNGGNVGTGQQPVGRTRAALGAATAAQAGGSDDGGQRAKWVRQTMLLRLRERYSCWAGFRVVLTRKGIDAMCKAYKKRRKKRRNTSDDETEASADESRADPGTAEPEQTASAPPRERWEEVRGGRRPQPTMEDPSPDGAGQTMWRRSRRAGRDEGGSRTLRRSAGGIYEERLGAAGTRGTMWKTASASPPSGGRPQLCLLYTSPSPRD